MGQWRPLEPPIRIHQSGVLAPNPLSWTFCSPLPTSTSLRIPVRVRHHNYLSQRITLVRSKVRTGKGSRTALLQYSDCLEFGKRPALKELASSPSTSPSFTQPNDQHVYLSQLPRYSY